MQKKCDVRSFRDVSPNIASGCYIDLSSVIIGDVTLGDAASVWPLVVIRGDVNYIKIGIRTNIQDGSVLHVSRPTQSNPGGYPLIIGDEVTVGHNVMLHGCVIHNRVLIGMSSTIMDGAEIGSECVIGAGSLVPPNKQLEGGYLYHGSPVKQIRPLTDIERESIVQSAENYVGLSRHYL